MNDSLTNPMIRKISATLTSLFLVLFITGCINEETSDCAPNEQSVRLYISYTAKTTYASQGIDPASVERLMLYAFDDEGLFVGQWEDPSPLLDAGYYMTLSLTPGNYSFVVWGNLYGVYSATPQSFIKGQTRIDDAVLHLQREPNDLITSAPHRLFFGHTAVVQVKETGNQQFVVPIVQHTNKINITVNGLTPDADSYHYTITDTNGSLKFDNTFAPCAELHYTTTLAFNNYAQLSSSLTVLRLAAGRTPVLKAGNLTSGKPLFEYDLMDLLQQAVAQGASIDFDQTNEYDIVIQMQQDAVFGITVNGWVVIETPGGV